MLLEKELIESGVIRVAELMAIAAKTAPKAKGIDNIDIVVISSKEELEKIASKMEELAPTCGDFFKRDAANVRNSIAVIAIGVRVIDYGIKTPPQYKIDANLVLSLLNLGIAIGSAVKIASLMNVDNRVMYSVGVAIQELKILNSDFVIGIPLSATSKNIYFDRK